MFMKKLYTLIAFMLLFLPVVVAQTIFYTDQVICQSSAFIGIDDAGASNFKWICAVEGVIIVNPNSKTTEVIHLKKGSNTFQCSYTNGSGSTSLKTLTISVNPVEAIAPSDKTTCDNFLYLSADRPSRGTGVWTLLSGNAKIDTPNENTTYLSEIGFGVNKLLWTVTYNECVGKDTVIIENISFPVDAGADRASCSSSVSLQGSIPPANATGRWSKIAGGGNFVSPSNFITEVTDLSLGTNLFLWTVSNGTCTASDEIIITYNKVTANAGTDQTLCRNYTFLAANTTEVMGGDAYGLWTVEEGGVIFQNNGLYNTMISEIAPGSNRLRWTVKAKGCEAYDEVLITNNVPSTPNAGEDRSICTDFFQLDGIDPLYGQGFWISISTGPIIERSTVSNTNVTNLSYGSNVFRWTVRWGECSAFDDVIITNKSTKASAGNDKALCDDYATLYASLPLNATGIWTVVNGQGRFDNDKNPVTTIRQLSNGDNLLRWTVSLNNCTAFDDVLITNNKVSDAVISTVGEKVCNPYLSLVAQSPMYGKGEWTVIAGSATFANPSSAYTTVVLNQQGINRFVWKIAQGECSSTDVVEFENRAVFTNAGLDKVVCGAESVLRADQLNVGASGSWSIEKGYARLDNFQTPTTAVHELGFGENVFIWTLLENGCTDRDTISIINTFPSVAETMADVAICDNFAQLEANIPKYGTGKWSLDVGSGTIVNQTSNITQVTQLNKGINRFKWTIAVDDCTTMDVVEVVNNKIDTYAGKDVEICGTDYFMRAAVYSPEHIGKWEVIEPPAGSEQYAYVLEADNPSSKVIDLVFGRNTLRWTVSANDCSASDEVTIINNLIVANAGEDQEYLCQNYTILGANELTNGAGVWTVVSGYGIIANPSNNISKVSDLKTGINAFKWSITSGICKTEDEVILINRSVEARVDDDSFICSGGAGQLLASFPGEGTTGSWKILRGSGDIKDITNYSTEVTQLGKGINEFEWWIKRGYCTDADTMIISNFEFSVDFENSEKIVCSNTATVEAVPLEQNGKGIWTIDGGQGTIVSPSNYITQIENLGVGSNLFRWTVVQNGCSDSETISVRSEFFTANAGVDIAICNDYETLRAFVSQTAKSLNAKGLWEGVGSVYTFEYPQNWEDFSLKPEEFATTYIPYLKRGENKFRWTLSTPTCSFSDEVIITNNTLSYSAGDDVYTCLNETNLNAELPPTDAVYYWKAVNPQVKIADIKNHQTTVQNLPNGTTVMLWHVERNGCVSEESMNIFNNKLNIEAGTPKYTENGSIELTGIPLLTDASGKWEMIETTMGSVSQLSNNTAYISGLDYGISKVRWVVNKWGCISIDTAYVTHTFRVNAGEDQSVCNGVTNLNAAESLIAAGVWSVVSGDVSIVNPNSRASEIKVEGNQNAVLRWSVEKNGYVAHDDVVIKNKIQLTGSSTRMVCENNSFVSAQLPNGTTGNWSVIKGEGVLVVSSEKYSQVTQLSFGDNIFRYSVTDGVCSNYIDQKIIYQMLEKPTFVTLDTVVCNSNIFIEANLLDGATGTWTRIKGSGYLQEQMKPRTPVIGVGMGQNTYRWTVSYGECTAFNDINIYYTPLQIEVNEIVDVDCHNQSSGIIRMTSIGGYGTKLFSIDNGITYFDNNGLFTDIPAMAFKGMVKDQAGCVASSIELKVFQPEPINIEVVRLVKTSSEQATDGIIELKVSGGVKPYEYVLNGATLFQNPLFTKLSRATYEINVVDLNDCKKGVYINLSTGDIQSSIRNELTLNHCKVYPNPTKNSFKIETELNTEGEISFQLFDVSGRLIRILHKANIPAGISVMEFDISELKSGVYFVEIKANTQRRIEKLMVVE